MIIRRYKVKNMNEAITRIRYELGREAVIISQRKIRKGGFLGFFSKKILEVTAAVDNSRQKDDNSEEMRGSIEALKKAVGNKAKINSSKKIQPVYNPQNRNNDSLVEEVRKMRGMLDDMMNSKNVPVGKTKLQLRLESIDLDEAVIKKIMRNMEDAGDDGEESEKLDSIVAEMIKVENKPLENAVVLVGPTGVGKTTTIAKLAGRLSLIEKKKVGLITIDTYRIGAVEQLRTYADIMNIPFKVVISIKEMEKAIDSMKECDVVLVDTTGRSSKNKMQISELRAFIDKVNTNNIHLVISCTTKNRDIDVIVDGYRELNYSNIIITKLDETSTYGSILNIIEAAKKPVSFVTTGQNVPEDIKVMNSGELAKLVTGEDIIC
ncbi:MAG: flagellar biosynthesis protein FlhF [Clostridium sp.]|uniref:flagellar biosynthesis protein FlhF n=1 Tax=Clostridium sp. TaxID=1506 RepID=UPI0025C02728|nr:flagellar biosynthesis protein FlhF [Clostridium sp.]MCH3964210.1 flagellar biosynthesis protein FlhF [Clostridium sp.]MCI1715391.1 flagellar biosynthesis protein FlhF [Clostridium sp.]MCI1799818.1 flagellar biosynthesis protein FlhF [Clostridium sp.]MCI1813574.1 flagellar biosynthesis protein FlhF [Clostridium sp.]MCI1870636.1 flagellar biosynthesis protein FlhF [Clostridium sp.]